MLGKVYFPRLIMPLSIVLSNLIRFAVQFLLFLILMVIYSFKGSVITPNVYLLLFPVLIVLIAGLGLGLGMIVSAVTTKYRDLAFVVSFDEFDVSFFLTRGNNMTLPIRMYLYMQELEDPSLAALSTLLIGVSIMLVVLVASLGRGSPIALLLRRRRG